MKKINKGYTLIELIITLAIIAILFVVIFFVFNKVNTRGKINDEFRNINIALSMLNSQYNLKSGMEAFVMEEAGFKQGDKNNFYSKFDTPVNLQILGDQSQQFYFQGKYPTEAAMNITQNFKTNSPEKLLIAYNDCMVMGSFDPNNISAYREQLTKEAYKKVDEMIDPMVEAGMLPADQAEDYKKGLYSQVDEQMASMSDEDIKNRINENGEGGSDNSKYYCNVTVISTTHG